MIYSDSDENSQMRQVRHHRGITALCLATEVEELDALKDKHDY
jgi:hypothetical protein